jgi:hypothetical protein
MLIVIDFILQRFEAFQFSWEEVKIARQAREQDINVAKLSPARRVEVGFRRGNGCLEMTNLLWGKVVTGE